MEIRLEVYAANTVALKAYEKVGFVGHMLTMRLNLEENQA
jgi:predicted GNAT family acetyltransferase